MIIRARNRQIVNGAVRRLGSAPIPGRRSNSACSRQSLHADPPTPLRRVGGKIDGAPILGRVDDALFMARVGHKRPARSSGNTDISSEYSEITSQ